MTFSTENENSGALSLLACPSCGAHLERKGKSLFCTGERRHCFDIAADGYVNLLPPGKMSNAKTGDDPTMISARRSFLSGGFYNKISDTAAEAALKSIGKSTVRFADCGCGEGYHTLRIADALSASTDKSVSGIGFDASKKGVAYAARRAKSSTSDVFFAAGNIFQLPLGDACIDVLFSLFAPIPGKEAMRVLAPDGIILVVSSGARHLWELREILYGEPRESAKAVAVPDGFVQLSQSELSYRISLESADDINNLFAMTPFFYRTPAEGRERLSRLSHLDVGVQVEYTVLGKINAEGGDKA